MTIQNVNLKMLNLKKNHNEINIYFFPSGGLNFCTLHFDLQFHKKI